MPTNKHFVFVKEGIYDFHISYAQYKYAKNNHCRTVIKDIRLDVAGGRVSPGRGI